MEINRSQMSTCIQHSKKAHVQGDGSVGGGYKLSHTDTCKYTHRNTCRFAQRASYSHGLVRLPLWSFNLHGSTLIPKSCSSLFHSGDPGGKYQSEAGHVDYCLFGIKSCEVSVCPSSLSPFKKDSSTLVSPYVVLGLLKSSDSIL